MSLVGKVKIPQGTEVVTEPRKGGKRGDLELASLGALT